MTLNLNAEQQVAANAIDGNFCVIAGPGSGKTAVLIERYRNMRIRGIQEQDILNLTFTNAAATEMVQRAGILSADKVFRTFHSYAMNLLQREKAHLPFPICDTIIPVYGQEFQLLRDLLKTYPAISTFRSLRDKLAEWKCSNISPEQAKELSYHNGPEFFYACAFADYERKCREQGWLDFDDCIVEAVNLLENNTEVRERNKKKYVAIDEFQDTDARQLKLLELLYDGNVFCVGDMNQGVYEWRGAHPDVFKDLKDKFSAKILFLGQNYRSSRALVSFFKQIIPVDNGLASHMISEREEGTPPVFTKFDDEIQEASVILSRVTDPSNSVVIARTNRQLLAFQKVCMARGQKSQILGRKNLWQQTEVVHLLKLAKEKDSLKPAHEVLAELIQEHNLTHLYRNSGAPMEKSPVENLNDIVKLSAKRGTIPEFLTWLRKLTYATKSKKKPDAILTLSTAHQMKGREAKYVFVIGVKQGTLPHKEGEILEEHRIWFVACSRASDELHVSFYGSRSQFLNDFQDQILIHGEQDGSVVRQ